jgi:hypothetical protein
MMTLQIGEDDIAFIKLGANFKQLCLERTVWRTHNSTFAIGGADVVTETFQLRINISNSLIDGASKSPPSPSPKPMHRHSAAHREKVSPEKNL